VDNSIQLLRGDFLICHTRFAICTEHLPSVQGVYCETIRHTTSRAALSVHSMFHSTLTQPPYFFASEQGFLSGKYIPSSWDALGQTHNHLKAYPMPHGFKWRSCYPSGLFSWRPYCANRAHNFFEPKREAISRAAPQSLVYFTTSQLPSTDAISYSQQTAASSDVYQINVGLRHSKKSPEELSRLRWRLKA